MRMKTNADSHHVSYHEVHEGHEEKAFTTDEHGHTRMQIATKFTRHSLGDGGAPRHHVSYHEGHEEKAFTTDEHGQTRMEIGTKFTRHSLGDGGALRILQTLFVTLCLCGRFSSLIPDPSPLFLNARGAG